MWSDVCIEGKNKESARGLFKTASSFRVASVDTRPLRRAV